MFCRTACSLMLIAGLAGGAGGAGHVAVYKAGVWAGPPERPLTETPFVGLSVRDTSAGNGVVVGWIYPGPLGGTGFESTSGIKRGDTLMALYADGVFDDEHRLVVDSAERFKGIVDRLTVGERVGLGYKRAEDADGGASVPAGGHVDEQSPETQVVIEVANKDTWTGTIRRGLGDRVIAAVPDGEFAAMIDRDAKELGVLDAQGGLKALLRHLQQTQADALDPNSLSSVVRAFRKPMALDAIEAEINTLVKAAASGQLEDVNVLIRQVLDIETPEDLGWSAVGFASQAAQREERFKSRQVQEGLWNHAAQLVSTLCDSVYIYDENATDSIRVIQASMDFAWWRLAWDLARFDSVLDDLDQLTPAPEQWNTPVEDVPEAVRQAVQGDILAYAQTPGGLIVIGGSGSNQYDMTRIAKVKDVGGDDVYSYSDNKSVFDAVNGIRDRVVIDLAGDDIHESNAAFAGPATGVFGLSILIDKQGNDTYRCTKQFSIGAGLFGIGVLIDEAGNDRYENLGPDSGWAMGTGFYGCGLIIDKAGSDEYLGEKLVQGVGGPRGLGMIIDGRGNDIYKANGPNFGSVYGTPGVFVGMSQGFGYGIRGYAAGGLGAIYDMSGDDRYEAGEFSQAGGYYFGMGIMHDAAGRDLYMGNRYGQAFAAHQAIGILVDDAGDDVYWSMTAASQAGTWDQCIGMLIDRAGNDVYRCDGLGQGAASQQALALLIDLDGTDTHIAGGTTLGTSGQDVYHADSGVYSFSALIDLGQDADIYPAGRPGIANNSAVSTGTRNDEHPEQSSLHGIFIDR